MAALSKDQIEKLPQEQQEALAEVELSRLRQFERLRDQARCYPGRWWFPAGFLVAIMGLLYLHGGSQNAFAGAIVALFFVIVHFHVNGLNRRLDAILQLMDSRDQETAGQGPADNRAST